jgi:hypothetical protein
VSVGIIDWHHKKNLGVTINRFSTSVRTWDELTISWPFQDCAWINHYTLLVTLWLLLVLPGYFSLEFTLWSVIFDSWKRTLSVIHHHWIIRLTSSVSGGCAWLQDTYHSHGVDGEARADDICSGSMQYPAYVHPRFLLEGPQEQPCKLHMMTHVIINFVWTLLLKLNLFLLGNQLKFIGVGAWRQYPLSIGVKTIRATYYGYVDFGPKSGQWEDAAVAHQGSFAVLIWWCSTHQSWAVYLYQLGWAMAVAPCRRVCNGC